jgi:hypothetical protein
MLYTDVMAITVGNVGTDNPRNVAPALILKYLYDTPVVMDMLSKVIRGCQRPVFLPVLGRHVGDIEDAKADILNVSATALLNAAMILLFAPSNPVFEDVPDWHTDLKYKRRYPTPDEPSVPTEDLLGGVYTPDDMYRVLSLIILCGTRFDKGGSFYPYARPTSRTPTLWLGRSDPSMGDPGSKITTQQGEDDDDITTQSIAQGMAISHKRRNAIRRNRSTLGDEHASTDGFQYYDPTVEREAREKFVCQSIQDVTTLTSETVIDYWTTVAQASDPSNIPNAESGNRYLDKMAPITDKAMSSIIKEASTIHGQTNSYTLNDRTRKSTTRFTGLINLEHHDEFVNLCMQQELYKAMIGRGEIDEAGLRRRLSDHYIHEQTTNILGEQVATKSLRDAKREHRLEEGLYPDTTGLHRPFEHQILGKSHIHTCPPRSSVARHFFPLPPTSVANARPTSVGAGKKTENPRPNSSPT